MQGKRASALKQLGCALFRPRTTIYSIAITLSTENAQNAQSGVR